MSTDQPIPASQRQPSGTSVHETDMDATGERIWSAYGSSPGLIDLDFASTPTEFSTLTRGAGSLSADIFARWGSHAGAPPSSRVPMPFAGLRLQRTARTGVRGRPAAAGRRSATAVVARTLDGASTAGTSAGAMPLDGPVPTEIGTGAQLMDPPRHALTPAVDRVARAQATAVTRTTRSDLSRQSAPVASVARSEPLLLRATSRPPDAVPVSRATDSGGAVDQVQHQAGAPHAFHSAAANREEPATIVSETRHLPQVGTSESEIVQASSASEQVSAAPEVVTASGQSTPAEAPIRVPASARQSDVAEALQQDHVAPTAPSVAVTSSAENVQRALVMSARLPFQPLIWRKAATSWSGSLSRSAFAGPTVSVFHPSANARWPLVSRTALDRIPLNPPWTSGPAAKSTPRLADARTEPDVPSRTAVGAVPPQPFHGNSGFVIARAVGMSMRTTPAVLAVPSGTHVPRVFRAAAVSPTGTAAPATSAVAPAAGTVAPAGGTAAPVAGTAAPATRTTVPTGTAALARTAAPATGAAAPAAGTSVPATATWIRHPAPIGSLFEREPRLRVGNVGGALLQTTTSGRSGAGTAVTIHQPVSLPAGAVSSPFPLPLVSRAMPSPAVGQSTTTSMPASMPASMSRSVSLAASAEAGDASTPTAPVTIAGHASSSVPFGSGTWVTADTISRVAHSLFRSPLTPLARPAISYGRLDSTRDSASVPGAVMAVSRTALELARVASVPVTVVDEGDMGSAADSRLPAIQRADVAPNGDTPGPPALDAVVASASHPPGAFGSSTTFTPLLRPNLLLRSASPTLFRSSAHTSGAFGVSEMPAPTGHGAHELALTIIGRHSPATFDMTDPGSVVSRGLIQRSHAVENFAPMVNTPGVPASATAASSQGPLREVVTGRPLSRDVPGRAATPGHLFVFRKQTQGATGLPGRSIETLVPPIEHVSALPTVQTAASVPASEPQAAPAPAADGHAGSSAQSAGGKDIDELVERVSRRLSRQLAIEHERRGAPTWR